ncbi:MAG: DUF1822 family protein, partial [Cyanobacteria bacterium J06642_11]
RPPHTILDPDPRWCEAAYTSPKTLTRFRRGIAIQQDTFINICQAVGANWEEVVDRGPATLAESVQWELTVEADDALKEAIFELLKSHSGDASLSIRRIDKGSLIFVLEGSLEGFERIEYLYRQGLLTELAGGPILDVQEREPVRLVDWLQGSFGHLWQSPTLAVARTLAPVNGSNTISRAKRIRLGTRPLARTVQLLVLLTLQDQGATEITIQVHPAQNEVYLPAGLQLAVVDDVSGLHEAVEALDQDNWIQLEMVVEPEEKFKVQLQRDDVIITEDFIV